MDSQSSPQEKPHLHSQVFALQTQVAALETRNQTLASQLQQAKAQLEWFKRQIFGKRSEKIKDQDSRQLFFESFGIEGAPEEKKTPVKEHTRRPSKKGQDTITLPDDLPIKERIIDLPEKEKRCPYTNKPLKQIGKESTTRLAYKPGSYYIKKITRLKYARPSGTIQTPLLPETILERCQADESFLAHIIVQKYCDHLPLYRQSEILEREGIHISRQTLCKWVIRCGKALQPLHEELQKQIFKSQSIFIDETPTPIQAPGKVKQVYMWILVGGQGPNPPYRTYHFRNSRQHVHAEELPV